MSTTTPDPRVSRRRAWLRGGLIALGIAVIGAIALSIDFEPNLAHVDVSVVSGAPEGHYFAQVAGLARRARREGGRVRNLSTAGSGENLRRLADPGPECEVDFGLVQDGGHFDDVEGVELVARLPRGETLAFLGRDADAIADFRDLRGRTIGAGPEGSGTAMLVADLLGLPGFDSLDVHVVHAPVAEQVDAAARGELDLAALVLFEDARLIRRAVRTQHLQIASFGSAGAVASQLHGVSAGVIERGHYDAVHGIPATDRHVLRVDTLILASRCARRSEINALLSVLGAELPGFIEENRAAVAPQGLALSSVAAEFFENHGTPLVDQHLPRIVDLIPLSNFMTFVMGISILFNVMGVLNRFRLWRLDVGRTKIEGELRELFGGGITRAEIDHLDSQTALTRPEDRVALDALITRLQDLLERCREHATSMLVPMGQEMSYRYQEDLMMNTLADLRRFRRSLPALDAQPSE